MKRMRKEMQEKAIITGRRSGRVVPVLMIVAAILLPFAYSVVNAVVAGESDASKPFLERPDAKHESCVKDTEYMRFHHWELLRRIREEVVRFGIRGEIGFDRCRECHTSRERFCNRCHDEVNLTPDCFGCHYYP